MWVGFRDLIAEWEELTAKFRARVGDISGDYEEKT